MIIIEGTVISGLSLSARKLPEQWPIVVRFIPAIQQCEQRTINVQLKHALHVKEPDVMLYVPWGTGSENVSIIEIELNIRPMAQLKKHGFIILIIRRIAETHLFKK